MPFNALHFDRSDPLPRPRVGRLSRGDLRPTPQPPFEEDPQLNESQSAQSEPFTDASDADDAPQTSMQKLSFALLLMTTAILFIRPQDLFPAFNIPHLYEGLIVGTLLSWLCTLKENESGGRIFRSPLGVCVLLLLPAAMLSNLVHGRVWEARTYTLEFSKKIIYFVLLAGVINTPKRLKTFLKWMCVIIALLASMSLLQYHHIIHNKALEQYQERQADEIDPTTGQEIVLLRLRGAGIFADPNDLCLVLASTVMCVLYCLRDARKRGFQPLWLIPLAILILAVAETFSRGGLIAMLCGVGVLLTSKLGMKRAAIVGGILLPALLVVFGGRQTDIGTEKETANQRIQLWSQGLQMFKSSPVFGIGMLRFDQEAGLVAHNSYVHCFAEMGFFGGSMFIGAFAYSIWGMWPLGRLRRSSPFHPDPVFVRLRPYLFAAVVVNAEGYLTLSRAYVEPTYLMFALIAIYLSLSARHLPEAMPKWSWRIAGCGFAVSVAFIGCEYVFVRLFAHWG